MKHQPPRLLRLLLQFYCNPRLLEELEGDLEELFQERVQTQGLGRARWRYAWDVFRCIRPYAWKRQPKPQPSRQSWVWLKHCLRMGWRQLIKHQSVSLINLAGLAMALTICLGMAVYVYSEWDFDSFHQNADRLYLVELNDFREGQFTPSAATVPALGPAMQATIPEVEAYCRLFPLQGQISYRNAVGESVNRLEEQMFMADSSFWQMFSFTLLQGNPKRVLCSPFTAYLSRTAARQYFGNESPIGKVLKVNEHAAPYTVAGVFEDVPYNSHLWFRVLLSYASMDPSRNTDWNWSEDHTYAMLKAGVEPRVVERKMDALVRMHHSEGSQDQYCLQPLQRIHLHQEAPYGNAVKGDSQMVTFLALAAGLILFIALVNFTNIAIAQTWQRSREIGVRKVMGARQEQVSVQLVSETLVLHTGVFLLSAVLSLAGFPLFHSLTGIPLSYLQVHIGAGLFLVLGFTLLILTASFLPVWFISSCRNWELLKGPFARPRQGIRLRKGLIVLQYAITLVLGAGTWIVYRQIQFLRQQDLGIRIDQVLIVRDPLLTDSLTEGKYEPLKNRLLSHPAIEQVSFSSSIPGKNIDWHRSDIRLDRPDGDQTFSIRIAGVGHDYFQLFELALLAGRRFAPDFGTDQTAMVISAKAAGLLGFAEPEMALEHTVFIGRRQFRVIGVVSDYHHLSFHHPVEPQLYILGSARRPNLSIRLSARQLSETMAFIRQQWQETYPDNVYNAFFLNDFFDRQYQRDQQFGRGMNLFGGISLALSVLGLWSFAFFNNQQRSREMAIRRVLGGSVRQLLGLLMTEYLQLLLMGYLLALPVLWLGIQTWLSHYTHRIPLQGWMVAVPAGIILVLTVLAIVRNTYRVSHVRPVQFLRHD